MTATRDHISNEFADMACNGLQWLRNIKEGISTVDDALAEIEANMVRIRALQAELLPKPIKRIKGYNCSSIKFGDDKATISYTAFNETHAQEARSTLHADGLSEFAAHELVSKWNRGSADGRYVYALADNA